jgi:hypothetical protein
MDEAAVIRYITGTFDGIETETAMGATFFFYGPERMLPLATLVTDNQHDSFSDLDRPSVFRLNIGVSRPTFEALFGSKPAVPTAGSGYDFTALDRIMPHPVYGNMSWACVLSPGDATFQSEVAPLLAEAYELAVKRHRPHAGANSDS